MIKNYVINCDGNLKVNGAYGLFSGIGGDAVIENLGVENVSIRMGVDYHWVSSGAVAGVVKDNAQITNCYVKNITDDHIYANGHYSYRGGMAGRLIDNASVTNSYSVGYSFTEESGSVNGAGIIGKITSTSATMANCYSNTTIAIAEAGGWGSNWYYLYYPETTTLPWPFEYWHGTNSPMGYIGEPTAEADIKAVPANIKSVFAVDKQNINNGYPILNYQVLPNVLNGAGTESDPYLINNADDLSTLGAMKDTADKYFMLTADIDLANEIWTPMFTESKPFKGDLERAYSLKEVAYKDIIGFTF